MKITIKIMYPDEWNHDKPTPDLWIPKATALLAEKGISAIKLSAADDRADEVVLELLEGDPTLLPTIKKVIREVLSEGLGAEEKPPFIALLPRFEEDAAAEAAAEDASDEQKDEQKDEAKDEEKPDADENAGADDRASAIEDLFAKLKAQMLQGTPSEGKEKKGTEEKKDPFAEIRKKLDELVNVSEFRALCEEIISLSPGFLKHKSQNLFSNQVYLFSIGEGQGLSSCLKILGETIIASQLTSDKDCCRTNECYLPFDEGEKNATWSSKAYSALGAAHGRASTHTVLCYDISEWAGHLTNSKFIEFMRNLSQELEDVTVVFTVPYLDKDVLSRVQEGLSDVFFTRTVVFPPLSMAHLRALTEIELKKYGYKLTDGGWTFVEQKLSEEKSDGRFYGVNTLKKVISELLYKKELANVRAKKDSSSITKNDAKAICSFHQEVDADAMLGSLVGMEDIKQRLKEVVAQIEYARSVPGIEKPCIHMRFVGNPGTGKTTIARILGKLLKEKGILRIGNFFEYSGRDFCGKYIGETAPKTTGLCRDAYGSVLFIDEAYSLYRGEKDTRDYGREALDTLIAEMENHRDDMLVIMAGYPDEMDTMLQGNVGLQSRMPYTISFSNYSKEQLFGIFMSMLKQRFAYEPDVETAAKEYFDSLDADFLASKEFSNGRFVRNLFERTWAKASMRCEMTEGKILIKKEDFLRSISDDEFKKSVQTKRRRFGFGVD